jgi:2,3-bisphosphoglycerate-independent phosphoglycerate mutase
MKYVILHGEGLVDRAYPELGGKTPLQAAATPNMDALGQTGELGRMAVQPEGPMQSLEITTLGLLGYDPRKVATGPAPFEALGLGVALGEQDVAFRCSMVTLKSLAPAKKGDGAYPEIKKLGPQVALEADNAGGITTEEARELIDAVNEQLGSETIQFYHGTEHEHFMVWVGGTAKATCVDPHEVVGRSIGEALPTGENADVLRKLMEASLIILGTHPVNDQRQEAGLKPANCLWLWGQGKTPKLAKISDRFQVVGAVVSPSDLVRGIGVCAGLRGVDPDEFTRDGEIDLSAQGERGLRELETCDFLYLHTALPASDEGREDPKTKCGILEEFDRKVVGVILDGLKKMGTSRVCLIGDGCASARKPDKAMDTVLYAYRDGTRQPSSLVERRFNEAEAKAAEAGIRHATKLVGRLFARS